MNFSCARYTWSQITSVIQKHCSVTFGLVRSPLGERYSFMSLIFGCAGSSLLGGFLSSWGEPGATRHHGARAFLCGGLSCREAQVQ